MFSSGGDLSETLLITQVVCSSGAPGQQGELLSMVVVQGDSEEEWMARGAAVHIRHVGVSARVPL